MTKVIRLLLIIAAAAALGSCSASRKAAAAAESPQPEGWHILYAPVKISVQQPVALSSSGRATMVRDSLVHISLRILGMEIAQLRATTDSVWVVDKYHKIYSSMPLAGLSAATGLSLADVQNLLLGRAALSDLLPDAASRVSFAADNYVTAPDGAQVASDISFTAAVKERNVAGSLRWDFDRARWNEPVDTEWKAPSGYRRIEPEELLKSLKSL